MEYSRLQGGHVEQVRIKLKCLWDKFVILQNRITNYLIMTNCWTKSMWNKSCKVKRTVVLKSSRKCLWNVNKGYSSKSRSTPSYIPDIYSLYLPMYCIQCAFLNFPKVVRDYQTCRTIGCRISGILLSFFIISYLSFKWFTI